MASLIMLIGLPGSGKSTYAKEYLSDHVERTVWCSSDSIRKELYGDETIQGNASTVFSRLHDKVAHYLRTGYDVIYDATNVNRKSRKTVIAIAKSIGAKVRGVIVWATPSECITRDAARDRTVGSHVIDKFIRRWESPYFDEGFDSLSVHYTSEIDGDTYANMLLTEMDIEHENPHHQLNVLQHCLESSKLSCERSDNSLVPFVMKWHDCGKPYTKFFKPEAPTHAHYYNHQNVGGYLIYGLWNGNSTETYPDPLLSSWCVTNHMDPYFNTKYYQNLSPDLKTLIDIIHSCDVDAH